ncbi:MAG: pilus assembly protein [Rhizobiales bacterium]|nr:pilus assembly protein [Hyphomicrobiales bacterium]
MLNAFISRLVGKVRGFGADRRGNVAMIFGIAAVPTILAVGGFIDYERGSLARAQMQDALDATALALHTDAATMTQTQMNDFATKYFAANFANSDAFDVVVTPNYDKGGPTVTVTGSASVNTNFLPIIGIKKLDIGAVATTTWGRSRLRVALVLDNTLSMKQDGKMDALKTATTNLLGQLKKAATVDGDVYVSIIPFGKDVNADKTNYTKSWVRWDWTNSDGSLSTESWDANNGSCTVSGKSPRATCTSSGSCSISSKTTQSSCTTPSCSISGKTTQSACTSAGTCSISSKTTQSTCTAAGTCSKSSYTSQSTCTSNRGTWTAGVWTTGVWSSGVWTAGVWTPAAHSTWNGCIMDRDQDYDVQNTAPTSGSTLFPAEQYTENSGCPGKLIGLTYSWTDLQKVVDGMSPAGTTNQTIGLQWGWQSLTAAPFTVPALDPDYDYKTVIIMLTDGVNTENRWNSFVSTGNSAVDTRARALCTKLHQEQITVWTVQVNTGTGKNKDPTQQVLIDCASSSDKFSELTTADQIITTFDAIGKALTDLRLSS